ncbi:SRPBCC domain-containing protein [Draconibacterium sediminis]|uniref:SRPBCC family protein n=1 Tax=Draconibacterium sediminis TaxID=1544798 RepID=UPI0026EBE088|nr:SRPBCC domain-containing protein [Draconibacterium sediminis]
MKKGDEIIVEQRLDTQIANVWTAITNLPQMKQWYFDNINHFQPETGSASQFVVQSGNRTFTHLWKVTEVNVPTEICYTWKYLEYPGDSLVRFNLRDDNGQTKLTLTQTVLEDFPDDIQEFKNESWRAGWNYFLVDRLPAFLQKNKSKNKCVKP